MVETETGRLEKYGVIAKIGLTPTDLMHIKGDFNRWDSKAGETGALCMAYQLDIETKILIQDVYENIKEKLFLKIAKTLIEDEDKSLLKDGLSEQLAEVLINGFRKARRKADGQAGEEHNFFSSLTTPFSLVGIGAPAHVFLKDVADAMKTKCIIPEFAHVANAVGAITGCIRAEVVISVTPNYTPEGVSGYTVFTRNGRADFTDYNEAVAHAKKYARKESYDSAVAKGAFEIKVSIAVNENTSVVSMAGSSDSSYGKPEKNRGCPGGSDDCDEPGNMILIETKVRGAAVGKPLWGQLSKQI